MHSILDEREALPTDRSALNVERLAYWPMMLRKQDGLVSLFRIDLIGMCINCCSCLCVLILIDIPIFQLVPLVFVFLVVSGFPFW